MRRLRPPARTVLIVLWSFAAICVGAEAGEELAAVSARPPLIEDAVPSSPSVAARLAEIQRRVQRAARYPAIARSRGIEGESVVAFEVDPSGRPASIAIEETSGSGALDRAAQLAVTGAGSLPWVYGRVQVPVIFELKEEAN